MTIFDNTFRDYMGNSYVCPQCGEDDYVAPGMCEMCQVELEQVDDQRDYGFHEEGEFDEEEKESETYPGEDEEKSTFDSYDDDDE